MIEFISVKEQIKLIGEHKTTNSIFSALYKNFFVSTDFINNKSKDITLHSIIMFHCYFNNNKNSFLNYCLINSLNSLVISEIRIFIYEIQFF